MKKDPKHHVVIIGGGFGGLACARKLAHRANVRVTLIDRRNHHLFQPLLYQVATTTLSSPDVARSLRSLFVNDERIDVIYDEAQKVSPEEKTVQLASETTLNYDSLVLATGARTGFFGNDHWAPHVHELKSLQDAVGIRKAVLRNLELADRDPGPDQELLSTVIIVGGGPTGVELAGAFSDLIKRNMKRNFKNFDTSTQRIILIEGQERLLNAFSQSHSEYTAEHLKSLGVEVLTQTFVKNIEPQQVTLQDGQVLKSATIIWTAGVEATPITQSLGAELTRNGLVKVAPDLSLPEHPSTFVIGDTAAVELPTGGYVPGVAPAATQAGEFVAELIATTPCDQKRDAVFQYTDKGKMAIIGKGSAIVEVKDWKTQGWFGWLIWLFVHILFLVDFRNKLGVLFHWFWAYVKNTPGTRVFTLASGENEESHSSRN